MNGKPVMLLVEADLDEGDDLTLDQAAQRVLIRLEAQRTALRDQYDRRSLALSALKTAIGVVALLAFWFLQYRSWRWVRRVYRRKIIDNKGLIPQTWRRFLGEVESRLYALLMLLLGITATYVLLRWAFSLFPWTRVWGGVAGRLVNSHRQPDCLLHHLGAAGATGGAHYLCDDLRHPENPQSCPEPGRRGALIYSRSAP